MASPLPEGPSAPAAATPHPLGAFITRAFCRASFKNQAVRTRDMASLWILSAALLPPFPLSIFLEETVSIPRHRTFYFTHSAQ